MASAERAVVISNSPDGTLSVKINTGGSAAAASSSNQGQKGGAAASGSNQGQKGKSVVSRGKDGAVTVTTGANSNTRLFIGGLTIRGADIKPLFSGFGRVIECDTDFDGFGFVLFAKRDDAVRAMDKLTGRKTNAGTLKISESTGRGYSSAVRRRDGTAAKESGGVNANQQLGKGKAKTKNSTPAADSGAAQQGRADSTIKPRNGTRIHVSGLKIGCKASDVKRMFSGYGKVVEIDCDFEGFAFVTFADAEIAAKAIGMDGRSTGGGILSVSIASNRGYETAIRKREQAHHANRNAAGSRKKGVSPKAGARSNPFVLEDDLSKLREVYKNDYVQARTSAAGSAATAANDPASQLNVSKGPSAADLASPPLDGTNRSGDALMDSSGGEDSALAADLAVAEGKVAELEAQRQRMGFTVELLMADVEKLSKRAEEAEALARSRLKFDGDGDSASRLLQAESRAEEAEQEVAELQAQLEATEAVVRAGAYEVQRAQLQRVAGGDPVALQGQLAQGHTLVSQLERLLDAAEGDCKQLADQAKAISTGLRTVLSAAQAFAPDPTLGTRVNTANRNSGAAPPPMPPLESTPHSQHDGDDEEEDEERRKLALERRRMLIAEGDDHGMVPFTVELSSSPPNQRDDADI